MKSRGWIPKKIPCSQESYELTHQGFNHWSQRLRAIMAHWPASEVRPDELQELIPTVNWCHILCFKIITAKGVTELALYPSAWDIYPYITLRPPQRGLNQSTYHLDKNPECSFRSLEARLHKVAGGIKRQTKAEKNWLLTSGG